MKKFRVIVGGGGGSRDTNRNSPSPGGFGGGGAGVSFNEVGVSFDADGQNLGGGGGRSALRYYHSNPVSDHLLEDLVTAGGGGGGGCSLYSNTEINGGGAGGGLIGMNSSTFSGLGGSQVSGGASIYKDYGIGGAGQKYQGGETKISDSGYGIGAGGGGGYYGGSSGASSVSSYGGGGGGSSFLGGCIDDGSAFTKAGRSGGNNLYRAPAVDANGIMPAIPRPPATPIAGCSATTPMTADCCYLAECFWGNHSNDCCCYSTQTQCFDSLPFGVDPYPFGYGGRAGQKGPEGIDIPSIVALSSLNITPS